jgi:hypothetical protein
MEDYEKLGVFYLGQRYDLGARRAQGPLVLYPSKNLTTHAVCIGMTGSGKTGLCLGLVEEAAIDQIPVLAIDPKGDLGNLLLAFSPLTGEALAPWVEAGTDPAQAAQRWKELLAATGQDEARIARLRDAADFAIYTPGSSAGLPLSILSSLAAPPAALAEDGDALRERVQTAVAGLLALAGVDADPVKSREAVLCALLIERTWRAGQDLELAGLIQALQQPPFDRVGALDLESFFPAKARFALAMALNQLLASPTFAAWRDGEPLDVQRLLFSAAGKPRVSIVSIAHLGDAERMFVTTQLLNALVGWMRTQAGTSSLRAVFYMDEVAGYAPPVANPPSKAPILTLLKQARAFGLGVVLATQNPVDLDYKSLANAGTWFIGRMQTERDKLRVLEGLEGAAASAGQGFDRARLEQVIAGLGNRVFLLHDVHEDQPITFQTRCTLSYLRGPLGRDEIKRLMAPRRRAAPSAAAASGPAASAVAATAQRPVLPGDIAQYFLPPSGAGPATYVPLVVANVSVRFFAPKLGCDTATAGLRAAALATGPIPVDWSSARSLKIKLTDLLREPVPGLPFAPLSSAAAQPKSYPRWGKDLAAWLAAHEVLKLWQSPSSEETSLPGESEGDFRARLAHESREDRDGAADKLRARYAPKLAALDERLRKAQAAEQREADQAHAAQLDTALSVGATIFGALLGGRRGARSVVAGARSAGRAYQQTRDVGRARDTIAAVQAEQERMQAQLDAELAKLAAARDPQTEALDEVEVRPRKSDVTVQAVALLWWPRAAAG